MADKKISELPAATVPLAGTEKFEILQGGVNKQVDASDVGAGAGFVTQVLSADVDITGPAQAVRFGTGASHLDTFEVHTATSMVLHAEDQMILDVHDDVNPLLVTSIVASPTAFVVAGYTDGGTTPNALVQVNGGTAGVGVSVSTAASSGNSIEINSDADVTITGDNINLVGNVVNIIGVNDLFVSAEAMKPQITNGCGALTQIEIATSLVNLGVLPFDASAQEFAQFQVVLPRRYNNSTVTVAPVWTAIAGTGTVQWGISFGSYRNDDALSVALGTPQTSDDTLIATNDLHIGPDTAAITPSGTITDGNLLIGRISRNVASDTLSADALLIGIVIRVTVDAGKDA